MNLLSFVMACLLLPPIKSIGVGRAVEKLRTNMNRINPFFRLATNIYHWNYKFSQTKRERRNRRPPSLQLHVKRQRSTIRPHFQRLVHRAKKKKPVKQGNGIAAQNLSIVNDIPSNYIQVIGNVKHTLSNLHAEEPLDNENLEAMLTEMHEMLH